MTRYFKMHPENPQPRLIAQAVAALEAGELLAYPTDSCYAFGCSLVAKRALETIRRLRGLDEKHPLTLLCHDISEVSDYCVIDDRVFRILKRFTPGPYTFILPATKKVPRPALGIKRKVVGIKIPEHHIAKAILQASSTPILSTTLWLPKDEEPLSDPLEIAPKTAGQVDLILDGGQVGNIPSTVIDLVEAQPIVIRRGLGDPTPFE